MGNYNPSAPIVLGEEWIGIRDETYNFAPGVSVDEVGHEFTLTSSQTLADARFYVADFPDFADSGIVFASVYPMGVEDQSGPIKRVIIPCNGGTVTGAGTSITNATTFAEAVFSPSDNKYVTGWTGGTSTGGNPPSLWLAYFAVDSFSQALTGKRILGVNVLYAIGTTAYVLPLENRPGLALGLSNSLSRTTNFNTYGITDSNNSLGNLVYGQATTVEPVARLSLGSFNPFWDPTNSPSNTVDRMPWTYQDLRRMEPTASNPYGVAMRGDLEGETTAQSFLFFLALEVFYCEEKRVAVGGSNFNITASTSARGFVVNTNKITMRNPLTGAVNPVLTAGSYLLTTSIPDMGYFGPETAPTLNALREVQPLSSHRGVLLDVPFPLDDTAVSKQFTSTTTHVLPQLSLHTSGAPLTEVHVYGRQAQAPVYGSVTATQEILDSAAGGATTWPQVRFYARRFGETSQPLLLDSPTIAGSSVSISPVEFDELDEVVDGWREVTLRFDTPPTMGAGTTPQWRFSASGETGGNQWQVLGMIAPALSGTVGSGFVGTVPSGQMLSTATYGAPSAGSTVNLGWQYPMVSATTDDATSDAFLLFSQDPPTPSNFAVSPSEQALSTVDPDCPDFAVSCIPNTLYFNELTWSAASGAAYDTFTDRTASNGWGTAEVGGAWTVSATASDFSVSDGVGKMLLTTTTSRRAVVQVNATNVDAYATFIFPAAASGGDLGGDLAVRYTDSDNTYLGRLKGTTTGAVTALIEKRVSAVQSTVTSTVTLPFNHTAGTRVRMRMQAVGSTLRFKAWIDGTPEPPAWTVEGTDTSLTSGPFVGMRGIAGTGSLNLPVTVSWDDFEVAPFGFGGYEIQRFDAVDGAFTTIMEASKAYTNTFNDYEARVGIASVYRIRSTNLYDFAGLWSAQVTGTVPSPGVAGADTALLIFTTNARQDGSSNLAYSSAWESGQPREEYLWPEAGAVVLQDMYSKDYPTAFRPLERGGERFARQILVNAAGVPGAALARGFESLRNMAWDTVPYICVRNEDGERWYSTVVVPSGNVRRMIALGRLCLAAVQVIETTAEPYPVDPS